MESLSSSMSLKEASVRFQEVEPGIQLASQLCAVRAPIVIPRAMPVSIGQNSFSVIYLTSLCSSSFLILLNKKNYIYLAKSRYLHILYEHL